LLGIFFNSLFDILKSCSEVRCDLDTTFWRPYHGHLGIDRSIISLSASPCGDRSKISHAHQIVCGCAEGENPGSLCHTQNAYASAIIEVEKDQRVVSTGLYAIVRHPMYFGAMIMILFTAVALGSLWALIPFAFMPFTIILRLLNEEKLLLKELAGYEEYCKKVRYRLIPYVW